MWIYLHQYTESLPNIILSAFANVKNIVTILVAGRMCGMSVCINYKHNTQIKLTTS